MLEHGRLTSSSNTKSNTWPILFLVLYNGATYMWDIIVFVNISYTIQLFNHTCFLSFLDNLVNNLYLTTEFWEGMKIVSM